MFTNTRTPGTTELLSRKNSFCIGPPQIPQSGGGGGTLSRVRSKVTDTTFLAGSFDAGRVSHGRLRSGRSFRCICSRPIASPPFWASSCCNLSAASSPVHSLSLYHKPLASITASIAPPRSSSNSLMISLIRTARSSGLAATTSLR